MTDLKDIVTITGRRYNDNLNSIPIINDFNSEVVLNSLLDLLIDELNISVDVFRLKNLVREYCGFPIRYPQNTIELKQIVEIVARRHVELFTREDYEKIVNARLYFKGER